MRASNSPTARPTPATTPNRPKPTTARAIPGPRSAESRALIAVIQDLPKTLTISAVDAPGSVPTVGLDMSMPAATIRIVAASSIFLSGGRFTLLERVHQRADDARARIRELLHRALGLLDTRRVAARDEQHVAGAEGDALRIGVLGGGRRIDEDHVVLRLRLGEHRREGRARQELERIGRYRTRGQDGKPGDAGDRRRDRQVGAPAQHRGEAEAVGDVEDALLPRRAEVGVDEERALPELRERHCQVRRDEAASFARAGAGDDQRSAAGGRVEPADE